MDSVFSLGYDDRAAEHGAVLYPVAVEYSDSVWNQLEAPQKEAIRDLYERFPAVFNKWNIPSIKELAEN